VKSDLSGCGPKSANLREKKDKTERCFSINEKRVAKEKQAGWPAGEESGMIPAARSVCSPEPQKKKPTP